MELTNEQLLAMHRSMVRIRLFEEIGRAHV